MPSSAPTRSGSHGDGRAVRPGRDRHRRYRAATDAARQVSRSARRPGPAPACTMPMSAPRSKRWDDSVCRPRRLLVRRMAAGLNQALSSRMLVVAVGDLGVEPAHDAGQGHRPGAIADDQVIGGKRALLLIKGGEQLALACPADDDPAPVQPVAVEGVQRVAELHHDQVGDVDHVVDGTHPDGIQPLDKPSRRRCDRAADDIAGGVAGAEVGVLDRHARWWQRPARRPRPSCVRDSGRACRAWRRSRGRCRRHSGSRRGWGSGRSPAGYP